MDPPPTTHDSSSSTKENDVDKQNDVNSDAKVTLEDWQIQRDDFKSKGDHAFRARGYRTAISEYTSAISLDPEYVVLYSNRSAAYLANSEISKALKDAQKCVELDPDFVKGYSRLAAALFALKRYEQAKEAYQRVLDKDPENLASKKGQEFCEKELERTVQEKEEDEAQKEDQTTQRVSEKKDEAPTAQADEEDDLLHDFFEDVEDVVTKKKEELTMATPTPTNAIRNDRDVLGSTAEQIERILQTHFEWRNLNPYYVLQLPAATATDEEISRRYKALSLLLHPDKNQAKLLTEKDRDRAQMAYDHVQKAKQILSDGDRKRYIQSLVEEGMKKGEWKWAQEQKRKKLHSKGGQSAKDSLEALQEREVLRIFAQVEQKRREVEERERKYQQRERQQEDDQKEKERNERKFDKQWRQEERVDKRVGNWRNFAGHKRKEI